MDVMEDEKMLNVMIMAQDDDKFELRTIYGETVGDPAASKEMDDEYDFFSPEMMAWYDSFK